MIQTIKFADLPEQMQYELTRSGYIAIDYEPLRSLSWRTGVSINTLRKLRQTKTASYSTWAKLLKGLQI